MMKVNLAAADMGRLRITKKLSPQSRGAIKLAARFGDALICVRHRVDAEGKIRHTTVELLVETTPIRPRIDRIVGVQIAFVERTLRARVRAVGATWDAKAKVWRLPRRIVGILGLNDRIKDL